MAVVTSVANDLLLAVTCNTAQQSRASRHAKLQLLQRGDILIFNVSDVHSHKCHMVISNYGKMIQSFTLPGRVEKNFQLLYIPAYLPK